MLFSLIPGFIGRESHHIVEVPMTKVHKMYSDLARRLSEFRWNGESSSPWLTGLGEKIAWFKELVKATFDQHCESGLNRMKCHLLDHVVQDLKRFGSLRILDGSPFERSNLHIKSA